MASAAIGVGCRVGRHCGRFGRSVYTGAVVVARFTRLHRGIDHAVVENTTGQFERRDAMAGIAIEESVRKRMADRLTQGRTRSISNMTGITACPRNSWAGVVRIGILKTDGGMAVTAFSVGVRVGAALADGGRLASGYSTVVTTGADSGYVRMIKAAVRSQLQKAGGIVAVIAFSLCWCMKFRFSDRLYTVMTLAAYSKYFLMIDESGRGKSQGSVTSLAHITGSVVIRHFR